VIPAGSVEANTRFIGINFLLFSGKDVISNFKKVEWLRKKAATR
jgi:hypothetical protein